MTTVGGRDGEVPSEHPAPGRRLRAPASLRAIRALAANHGLLRLQLAWGASVAGDWTFVVAVMVAAYTAGGAVAVGGVGVARMLVAAVSAPLVASMAGRFADRDLLAAIALLRIGAMLGSAAVVVLGGPPIVLLPAVALEAGAFAAVRPVRTAMLPALALEPAELVAANVASSTAEGIGLLVGPAIGGLVMARTGVAAAAAVAAAMLVVDAAATLPIRVTQLPASQVRGGQSPWRSIGGRLGRGVRVVRRDRVARVILFGFSAQVVVRGILGVLLVVLAIDVLGIGEAGVGWLTSAIGLGGLIGALGATALVGRGRLAGPFALALVAWGLPLTVIGLLPGVAIAFSALVVVGAANAALDVAGFTLLQRIVPNEARAPVLGLLEGIAGLGVAAGSAVAPVLLAWLGPPGALVLAGLVLPLTALAAWPVLAVADDRAVIPRHELSLLRSLSFFAPLPLAAMEELARRMRPVTFAPGELLTRQGEEGDRFYVIDDGTVEVEKDGRLVDLVGPASAVGEIALLRRVPRTATVRATRTTRALALDGSDFIAAVTASPLAAAAVETVVAERVARTGVSATSE